MHRLAKLLDRGKIQALARPLVHVHNLLVIRRTDNLHVDAAFESCILKLSYLAEKLDEGAYLIKNTMKPLQLRRTLERQMQPYGMKAAGKETDNPKLARWWKEYLLNTNEREEETRQVIAFKTMRANHEMKELEPISSTQLNTTALMIKAGCKTKDIWKCKSIKTERYPCKLEWEEYQTLTQMSQNNYLALRAGNLGTEVTEERESRPPSQGAL